MVFNLSRISSGSMSRRLAIRIKRRLDPLEIKLQLKQDATAPSCADKLQKKPNHDPDPDPDPDQEEEATRGCKQLLPLKGLA